MWMMRACAGRMTYDVCRTTSACMHACMRACMRSGNCMMTSRIVSGAIPRITSRILRTGLRAGRRARCRLQVRMHVHGRGQGRFCWHAHMHVRERGMCAKECAGTCDQAYYVRVCACARLRVHSHTCVVAFTHTQAWCAYG